MEPDTSTPGLQVVPCTTTLSFPPVSASASLSLRPSFRLAALWTKKKAGFFKSTEFKFEPMTLHIYVYMRMYTYTCMYVIDIYTHTCTYDIHMAANQKHWPCNWLGRPFRDKGLQQTGVFCDKPATSPLKTTVLYTEVRDKGL